MWHSLCDIGYVLLTQRLYGVIFSTILANKAWIRLQNDKIYQDKKSLSKISIQNFVYLSAMKNQICDYQFHCTCKFKALKRLLASKSYTIIYRIWRNHNLSTLPRHCGPPVKIDFRFFDLWKKPMFWKLQLKSAFQSLVYV